MKQFAKTLFYISVASVMTDLVFLFVFCCMLSFFSGVIYLVVDNGVGFGLFCILVQALFCVIYVNVFKLLPYTANEKPFDDFKNGYPGYFSDVGKSYISEFSTLLSVFAVNIGCWGFVTLERLIFKSVRLSLALTLLIPLRIEGVVLPGGLNGLPGVFVGTAAVYIIYVPILAVFRRKLYKKELNKEHPNEEGEKETAWKKLKDRIPLIFTILAVVLLAVVGVRFAKKFFSGMFMYEAETFYGIKDDFELLSDTAIRIFEDEKEKSDVDRVLLVWSGDNWNTHIKYSDGTWNKEIIKYPCSEKETEAYKRIEDSLHYSRYSGEGGGIWVTEEQVEFDSKGVAYSIVYRRVSGRPADDRRYDFTVKLRYFFTLRWYQVYSNYH